MKSTLANIESIFASMSREKWDIGTELLWGFYFTSHDEKKLSCISIELLPHGYVPAPLEVRDNGLWVLGLSKRESLTSEKLHGRNVSFDELATRHGVEYDGWDVSK